MVLASFMPNIVDLTVRCMVRVGLQGLRECAPLELKRGIKVLRVCVGSLEVMHLEGEISAQLRQLLEDLASWRSAVVLSGTGMSQALDACIASFQEKLAREHTSLRSCEEERNRLFAINARSLEEKVSYSSQMAAIRNEISSLQAHTTDLGVCQL
ncbi:hypothetical protein AMTR_s00064p00024270 [Amborella trichopoda]|uniref:Uncharacterized protein n=1 Tax=Amborella trichopoda TaxID=13333 RepID=U5DB46_AMBTC|nr:hypothetical protein AMTR_s00064p00024270 [Amborella trichopoda]